MKTCYLCGKDRQRSEYHISKSAKDGLQSKWKPRHPIYCRAYDEYRGHVAKCAVCQGGLNGEKTSNDR